MGTIQGQLRDPGQDEDHELIVIWFCKIAWFFSGRTWRLGLGAT